VFVYTKHALEKMDALGIDKHEVERAIQLGMKWTEDDKWHARNGGVEIVFVKQEDAFVIVTTYLSRRKK